MKAPTGSPGCVWTDEPPDPTTFTPMLLRASRNSNAGALNTAKVKTAAAAVDRVNAASGSLENARFSGRASIDYSQPRVSSSYGVAWRYHQVTP